MEDQKTRKIYEEYFLCNNLYILIVNGFSLYLSYVHGTNNKDRIGDYKVEINEILKFTNMDILHFNKLLDEYIEDHLEQKEEKELKIEDLAKIPKKREDTPLETYIKNHQKKIEEKLKLIPKSINKGKELLMGLISAFNPKYYSDQIYDAILLLKDEVPLKVINDIREDWKSDAKRLFKRSPEELILSKIFWTSYNGHEQIDAISRYRFKTQFNFKEFEFAFEEVEKELEEMILETRRTSLGSYDLWLISRSQILADKLAGIDLKLKGYIINQQEDGYWKNENRPDITTPDMFMTALITLNLLKLSPSRAWRQSGIKGAKWILTKQNPDGSWSIENIRTGEKKPDIFITILCLEILKRCGLENSEVVIKKGQDWILNQQTATGMWNDEFTPFPFLNVLVLEYFKNKDLYSHQLPLFLDDLTPENIIFFGMNRAIEISKNCKSEPGRVSPKVGTVIIKEGEIVLEAYRGETSPGDHAEYIALEKKGRDFDLEESILITTLEPCTSRKPNKIPCAKRIVDVGIKEIWIGLMDPNPKIRGRGILYLTNHGVSVGYFPPSLSEEIKNINSEFWDDQIRNYFENTTQSQTNIMAINDEEGK